MNWLETLARVFGIVLKSSRYEGALWDCELTADEIRALASGVSPLAVRPDRLVEYVPFPPRGARDV